MLRNINLYIARFLTACVIYLFIAKANVWLDKIDNTLLVFGYRFFIVLAPFFFLISKKWIGFISFVVSTMGVLLWFKHLNFLGTLLFSTGIAVGTYVIKYYAVYTPKGAAYNAIILNLGVFLSGILIIVLHNSTLFLEIGLVFMVISVLCAFVIGFKPTDKHTIEKANFSFSYLLHWHGIAWAIIGLVCGIEFIGMFSILPQYLISHYHVLPRWYGWALPLSAMTVVLFQHPIIKFMQHLNLKYTLLILASSMIVITLPAVFHSLSIAGALLWVFVLTLFECAISYLDTLSVLDGGLLIKETFVGVGMAITVFVVRSMIPLEAADLIGVLGCLLVIFTLFIFKTKLTSIQYKGTT